MQVQTSVGYLEEFYLVLLFIRQVVVSKLDMTHLHLLLCIARGFGYLEQVQQEFGVRLENGVSEISWLIFLLQSYIIFYFFHTNLNGNCRLNDNLKP